MSTILERMPPDIFEADADSEARVLQDLGIYPFPAESVQAFMAEKQEIADQEERLRIEGLKTRGYTRQAVRRHAWRCLISGILAFGFITWTLTLLNVAAAALSGIGFLVSMAALFWSMKLKFAIESELAPQGKRWWYYAFDACPLEIPQHVLDMVISIRKHLPESDFRVYFFANDPILSLVRDKKPGEKEPGQYYLEQWDEDGFPADREVPTD